MRRGAIILSTVLMAAALILLTLYFIDPGWGEREFLERTGGVEEVPLGSTLVIDVPKTPEEGRFWIHFEVDTAFEAPVDLRVLDADGGTMTSEQGVSEGSFIWKFQPRDDPRTITVTPSDDVASGEYVALTWSGGTSVDKPEDIMLYQNPWVLVLGVFCIVFVAFALIASLKPSAPIEGDARRFLADVRLWRRGGI